MFASFPKNNDTNAINPFKQATFKHQRTYKLISIVIFLLRFPFLVLISFLFAGYSFIIEIIPSWRAKNIIRKMFYGIFYKVLNVFTGTLKVNIQPTPLVDRYSDVTPFINPSPGDLIISNLGSFLNLFFLRSFFSPIFVIPIDDTHVIKKGFFSLIIDHISKKDFRKGGKIATFEEVLEEGKNKQHVPICIFPEAAPGNCNALLKFQKFGIGCDMDGVNVSIIGFINSNIGMSTDNVVGVSSFWYLIQIFGRLCGSVKVRTALPQDVPPVPSNGINEDWISNCRTLMALIMRIPLSSFDVNDYCAICDKSGDDIHLHTD